MWNKRTDATSSFGRFRSSQNDCTNSFHYHTNVTNQKAQKIGIVPRNLIPLVLINKCVKKATNVPTKNTPITLSIIIDQMWKKKELKDKKMNLMWVKSRIESRWWSVLVWAKKPELNWNSSTIQAWTTCVSVRTGQYSPINELSLNTRKKQISSSTTTFWAQTLIYAWVLFLHYITSSYYNPLWSKLHNCK